MSRFLPKDFDASLPLALIAGQGDYPKLLAQRAKNAGVLIRLIELGDETSPELVASFPQDQKVKVKVGQVGKLLKELKKFGAGYAVMAGQVTPGKLFKGMHPDLKAIRMLAGLQRRNAETIFGAIGDEIDIRHSNPFRSNSSCSAFLISPLYFCFRRGWILPAGAAVVVLIRGPYLTSSRSAREPYA